MVASGARPGCSVIGVPSRSAGRPGGADGPAAHALEILVVEVVAGAAEVADHFGLAVVEDHGRQVGRPEHRQRHLRAGARARTEEAHRPAAPRAASQASALSICSLSVRYRSTSSSISPLRMAVAPLKFSRRPTSRMTLTTPAVPTAAARLARGRPRAIGPAPGCFT